MQSFQLAIEHLPVAESIKKIDKKVKRKNLENNVE
jgi:hypothetical protein